MRMIRLLIIALSASIVSTELVDLSHIVDENARNWPVKNFQKYNLSILKEYDLEAEGVYVVSKDIQMTEHLGTHLDAPHHFGKTAWDLSEIPLERLICPVVKIDVTEKCTDNKDYGLSVQDLREWEEEHGEVPYNAVILMETGWGAKYGDTAEYYGTDRDIAAEDFDYDEWIKEIRFPGFSSELADELLKNYHIAGIGTDTASVDVAIDATFPVHFKLAASNIYNLENLCNLDLVPAKGATLMAIPPKIKGGSGLTTRVIVDTASDYAYRINSSKNFRISTALTLLLLIFRL